MSDVLLDKINHQVRWVESWVPLATLAFPNPVVSNFVSGTWGNWLLCMVQWIDIVWLIAEENEIETTLAYHNYTTDCDVIAGRRPGVFRRLALIAHVQLFQLLCITCNRIRVLHMPQICSISIACLLTAVYAITSTYNRRFEFYRKKKKKSIWTKTIIIPVQGFSLILCYKELSARLPTSKLLVKDWDVSNQANHRDP